MYAPRFFIVFINTEVFLKNTITILIVFVIHVPHFVCLVRKEVINVNAGYIFMKFITLWMIWPFWHWRQLLSTCFYVTLHAGGDFVDIITVPTSRASLSILKHQHISNIKRITAMWRFKASAFPKCTGFHVIIIIYKVEYDVIMNTYLPLGGTHLIISCC